MARFDSAVGRYTYLTIDGTEYRVYFEEAGQGIPLILMHTAGADGRQWRHILEDPDVQKDYRMIVPDLPYHGKSVPPTGKEWWTEEYKLTRDFFMKTTIALSHELGLDHPVYMGSSIGGHLAGDLALYHPEEFRAVIGLEAALSTPGGYEDTLDHPRIGNQYKGAIMRGITSPHSPEPYRREAAWIYNQGAPEVFRGDIYYYCVDHDLTETVDGIDTSKVAVYLLTGEYDYGSTPEMSEEMARRIPGSNYQTMEGLGHFPMQEDPERFRGYILPVLEAIREAPRMPAAARTG